MQSTLPQIVKDAMKITHEGFIQTIEEATRLLNKENGNVGRLKILGRLVTLEPSGEALVIGDLHGDLESLVDILKGSNFIQKMSKTEDAFLIFLGDYGDRGPFSIEVYYTVLKLKLRLPTQVILMRGNHEGPEDLLASPHDLPDHLQARFGEKWTEVYLKIQGLFEYLYNAVLVRERYLMVHGGLTQQVKTVEDLAYATITHPRQPILENLLWSDPDETVEETCASPRGAGKLFGEKVTTQVLERLNVKILIRGHEPCEEGFKINHNGKILTFFSRKGPPYFNSHGAYLDVALDEELSEAAELVPFVHKF